VKIHQQPDCAKLINSTLGIHDQWHTTAFQLHLNLFTLITEGSQFKISKSHSRLGYMRHMQSADILLANSPYHHSRDAS